MIDWIVRLWDAVFGPQHTSRELQPLNLDRTRGIHEKAAPRARGIRRVSIARYAGPGEPPAFRWKECHPSTMARFKAKVCCPAGHGLVLKGHSIDENGHVWPSVVCPDQSCEFHEFVSLDGWDLGELR